MEQVKKNKLAAIGLILVLTGISVLKDQITPDYLNTPNAAFLNTGVSSLTPLSSVSQFPGFWFLSFFYSTLFVILPAMIVRLLFNRELYRYTVVLLAFLFLAEYLMVFTANASVIVHVLPKINRYFHSPIITLFLIAAFTLNNRNHGSD